MGNEQKKIPKNEGTNSEIQPSATTEYVEESVLDATNTTQVINSSKADKEPISVIVNLPPEDKKPQVTANIIAILGLLLSIVLGVLTYLLFLKTVEANKTSAKALREAERANNISAQTLEDSRVRNSLSDKQDSISFSLTQKQFNTQRLNDSISILIQKQNLIDNRNQNKQTIEIAEKSLQTQANLIIESQRQFLAINEPFMEIDSFKIVIEIDKPITIEYEIRNLNKYPARMLFYWQNVNISQDSSLSNSYLTQWEKITEPENAKLGKYVSFDKSYWGSLEGLPPLIYNKINANHLNSGKYFIYHVGFFIYENLVTKKKKAYRFIVRIKSKDEKYLEVNENIEYPIRN
jgi:hypothetical protein